MSDELKPCPWCGKTPGFNTPSGRISQVVCKYRGCAIRPETEWFPTLDEAIAVWNDRKDGD